MNCFNREKIDRRIMRYFEKNYKIVYKLMLDKTEMMYLGNELNKVCRFCGKTEKNGTTFNKIAHALPECIGNKCLASYYECDKCNERFGATIETEYANFMNLYHTISRIHGKKKIPKCEYKNQSKIVPKGNQLAIVEKIDGIHTEIDKKAHCLNYTFTAPTHIPVAVFKCFVKMALTIMPEEELKNFKETIEWVRNSKHENIYAPHKLLCRYVMIPGIKPVKAPIVLLFKRINTDTSKKNPYMIFNLTYGNFSYLIDIPTKNFTNKSIEKIPFPFPKTKTSSEGIIDFSSNVKKSDFVQKISFHYDEMKEIDLNENKDMLEDIIRR